MDVIDINHVDEKLWINEGDIKIIVKNLLIYF